nr:hypothetical protein [Tanacetum cinerariifolium]
MPIRSVKGSLIKAGKQEVLTELTMDRISKGERLSSRRMINEGSREGAVLKQKNGDKDEMIQIHNTLTWGLLTPVVPRVVVRDDDDEVETVRMAAAVGSGGCVGGGCGNDVDGGVRVAVEVEGGDEVKMLAWWI